MAWIVPEDIERALKTLLVQQLPGVSVESIGLNDIDEDGQVVFSPPCVRTRYPGSSYKHLHDNLALAYDADNMMQVWCADSDLRSSEDQREASKRLVTRVLPIVVGARLKPDWDPNLLVRVWTLPGDIVPMIYIIDLVVPGIAQFPGINDPSIA